MRKLIIAVLLISVLIFPVSAMDFTAPSAPESAQKYMPEDTETFSQGLWYIIKTAIGQLQPSLAQVCRSCLSVIAVVLLLSLVQSFSGTAQSVTELVGTIAISLLLIQPANTLIRLGADTVVELSEYGKLLLPVMTAALASQGGATTSAALYTATAIFSSVLTSLIANVIVPLTYIFLCLSIANSAIGEDILKRLASFAKWAATWSLKVVLYVFTGYISITGVVGGSADAAAVKATKLAISGAVPVVGSILSDASETILVSAGILKSSTGVYGLLVLLSILIGPFLQIGVQYLLLNITGGICSIFGRKKCTDLIKDFSAAMGLLLAMTGTVCLLLLISTICFMKGVSV